MRKGDLNFLKGFVLSFYIFVRYRKIEEKRGVTVTDSGIPEVKSSAAAAERQLGPIKTSETVTSTTKASPKWDEDWIPSRTSAPTLQSSVTNVSSSQPVIANKPIQVSPATSQSSVPAVSPQPTSASCPSVDLEWPPRSSLGVSPKIGDNEKQNLNGDASSSSFDDLDPFANWPPRPISISGVSGSYSNNGTIATTANKPGSSLNANYLNGINIQPNNSINWAFNTQNSIEPSNQNQGNSTLNASSLNSGLNSQSSLGFLKSSQGNSAWGSSPQKSADLGSIFTSSKSEQAAPRLAPPPATAVGRGRGRGRGNQGATASRSGHAKSSSEQPPLLDLL